MGGIEACTAPNTSEITEVDAPPFDQFAGHERTRRESAGRRQRGAREALRDTRLSRAGRPSDAHLRRSSGCASSRPTRPMQPGVGATTPNGARGELPVRHRSSAGAHERGLRPGQLPPEALMLLRKPLQLERHKGGAVIQRETKRTTASRRGSPRGATPARRTTRPATPRRSCEAAHREEKYAIAAMTRSAAIAA